MELTKKYYKIREVSEIIGVPLSTLRFWEQEFDQLRPSRNEKGTRFYTPADIELIARIKFLVHDRGLRVEAAKEQLANASNTVETRVRAIERLREIREKLVEMRDALHKLR